MQPISYARHQFPPGIIRHAIWLSLRFTLSYRDVEELLAARGLAISYEAVRRRVLKSDQRLPKRASAAASFRRHLAPGQDGALHSG
jgi:transposase-like protein